MTDAPAATAVLVAVANLVLAGFAVIRALRYRGLVRRLVAAAALTFVVVGGASLAAAPQASTFVLIVAVDMFLLAALALVLRSNSPARDVPAADRRARRRAAVREQVMRLRRIKARRGGNGAFVEQRDRRRSDAG